MLRWLSALVIAGLLTGFTALLVVGDFPGAGRVIRIIGPGHGLHIGDVIVMAGWAVGMIALLLLLRRRKTDI